MMSADDPSRRRARVRLLQRYRLNPPMKLVAFLGMLPGHVLIETTGRKTGKRRRTVVGAGADGTALWIVAEQGRHAGYVRNLIDQPRVRVRLAGHWRAGTATVVQGDDPNARLDSFGNERHAEMVRRFGTDLRTVRVDLDHP